MKTPTSNPAPNPALADRLRRVVAAAILKTAPDVADEIVDLDDDTDLFEEFGLDSMDRLSIMTTIAEATGVEVPDSQYPQLTTMTSLIGHLS
jgi:acyl carrier protein